MAERLRFLITLTGRNKRNGNAFVLYCTDCPFTTSPGDIVPDQYFMSRISQAAVTTRNTFQPGTTRGKSEVSRSNVILHNVDRFLDLLTDIDLRRVEVRCGLASATTIAEHTIVASGIVDKAPRISKQAVELVVTGARQLLTFPLQLTKFGGTNVDPNGIDGNADLAGKEVPWAFGVCKQVPLTLVNGPKLIYKGHDGRIDNWPVSYDKGVPLTWGGEYFSQAEIENDALQPSPGYFKTWANGGSCRLGSSPIGLVTADFTVGATAADRTRAKGMYAVWLKAGYVDADMLLSDLAAMDARDDAEIGLFFNDNRTGESVCDQIAAPDGWWGPNLQGLLRFAPIAKPNSVPMTTFTQFQILENQITMEPADDAERGRPLKQLTFQYARNNATQTDPAAGLDVDTRAYLTQEYRAVTEADASVGVTFDNAGTLTLPTLYADEAGARAALLREFSLRKVERYRFTFTVDYTPAYAAIDLGDIIGLNYPGFGLKLFGDTLGRAFLVIGVQPNAKAKTITFTVWGNSLLARNIAARPTGALLRARSGKYLTSRAA